MSNGFEQWGGYMEAKICKLRQQYNDVKNVNAQNGLFAGISIYVNGHTNPSAEELKRLIMINGGIYHHYECSDTSYIIASNLPDVKVRNMKLDRIISAQWVVDCIKEKRILDYRSYLLYTNKKSKQPILHWGHRNIKSMKVDKSSGNSDCNNKSDIVVPVKEVESKVSAQLKLQPTTPVTALEQNEYVIQEALNVLHNKLKQHNEVGECNTNGNVETICGDEQNKFSIPSYITTPESNFLDDFQNNSRLHQISTLASRLKQHIHNLRSGQNRSATGISECLQHLMNKIQTERQSYLSVSDNIDYTKHYVMHIDMDCFFISVGLRKHPHLKNLPTVVTHRTIVGANSEMSMAEVACASYEARKYGIKNGMLMGEAWSLCPTIKVMPYDFEGYVEVAFSLYNTMAQYTLNIEAVSCDEMYVDITDILKMGKMTPMEFMSAIRDEVFHKTACCCSAGVGNNKLQARLATKKAKPNGQYHMDGKNIKEFLSSLPIHDLPGIGHVTSTILKNAGLVLCGDIINNQWNEKALQQLIGLSNGKMLYNYCQGIDNRQLEFDHVPNSVSVEMNYGIRYDSVEQVENALFSLSTKVHEKLLNIKRKTKCITLKIMVRAKMAPVEAAKYMGHGICDTKRKSISLLQYTDEFETVFVNSKKLMQQLSVEPCELRGLGVQLSKLNNTTSDKAAANTSDQKNRIDSMFEKLRKTKSEKRKNVADNSKSDISDTKRQRIIFPNNSTDNTKKNKRNTVGKIFGKHWKADNWQNITTNGDNSAIDASAIARKRDTNVSPCSRVSNNAEEDLMKENLENLFLKTNSQKCLLNWFKDKHLEGPNPHDIDILCYMAKDLVWNHDIDLDKLHDDLIYLVSLFNSYESSSSSLDYCPWHLMFKCLLQSVNIEMMAKFNGRSMHMVEKLKCKKCTTLIELE